MEVTTRLLRILAPRIRQLRRGKYQALKPFGLHRLDAFPACYMGSVCFRRIFLLFKTRHREVVINFGGTSLRGKLWN